MKVYLACFAVAAMLLAMLCGCGRAGTPVSDFGSGMFFAESDSDVPPSSETGDTTGTTTATTTTAAPRPAAQPNDVHRRRRYLDAAVWGYRCAAVGRQPYLQGDHRG